MNNPTPQYDNGDRIYIPEREVDGEIQWRWYDEAEGCWIYRVYRAGSDRRTSHYKESELEQ